ncbi:MAG TPA: LapA family protein [Bradyrhizobium sp.]|uniref:LapA family protein n=1 Tax=Bradyrhizobium sp. TaxID=376 RepID=UPI002B9D4923|nr:LapA family protein [Bradyrhizobium sp.]HLZ04585.1 LapA family protein [Bradyrhizobium sp.]
MRKFFSTLFAILLGLIFVTFAVANRHLVTVSFDPFNSANPSVSTSMPLFVLIIVVAILGVIAGGCATWFGQRRWRRAARLHEADARTAKAQLAELRSQAVASRSETQRLALPPKTGFSGAVGRDRQGAAL